MARRSIATWRWITEQGGGYFAVGDTWAVGGDFEWLVLRVQQALGGTVCELRTADGTCTPLDDKALWAQA